MDCIVLFLIIIIVIGIAIIIITTRNKAVASSAVIAAAVGGSVNNFIGNAENKLIIDKNAKFIIDGHNLIHQLSDKSHLTLNEFKDNLQLMSKILTESLPEQEVHIVIKNPGKELTELFNEKYNDEKDNNKRHEKDNDEKDNNKRHKKDNDENNNNKRHEKDNDKKHNDKKLKTNKRLIPYFQDLVNISKIYPKLTYHLAYGKEPSNYKSNCKSNSKFNSKSIKHYLKGRDDFLALYLSKGEYVISHDKFKDFANFSDIKPFYHFSVTNGIVHPKERIIPKTFFTSLNKPTLGSHLTYKFITKEEAVKKDIKSGEVYVDKSGTLSCMYLIK
jgi:hypothetical protein